MTLRQAPTRKVIVVIAVLAAFAVAGIVLTAAWMSALTIPGMHHGGNENDLITEVSLIDTTPLVLSVKLKSNCSDDVVYLVGARVKDQNQTTVAEYWGKWGETRDHSVYLEPICVLRDFGAQERLTLSFGTSLNPGTYTLWFISIFGVVAEGGEVFTRADVERALYPLAHVNFTIPFSMVEKSIF